MTASTRSAALILLIGMIGCDSSSSAQRATQAPLAQLTDVPAEGLSQVLRDTPGRAVLVNLWSTWCQPCMDEMPALVALTRRHRERGLGAVFISMDIRSSRADALRFMQRVRAPSPSYIRQGRDAEFIPAVHAEWSGTLPATLLFDAQRRPLELWVGEAPLPEVEAAIARALDQPIQ